MSKARIEARFAALEKEGRAAFIPYVMAGDPGADTTLGILRGLPQAGADLIELGIPFSDPMAEGVPIQRAAQRALESGMTLRKTLDLVRAFRSGAALSAPPATPKDSHAESTAEPLWVRHDESILKSNDEPFLNRRPSSVKSGDAPPHREAEGPDDQTPVILMGYLNNILAYGLQAFAEDAAGAGVDGLIVVDCPPEEAEPLADALDQNGLSLIRLATPTSDDARLSVIAKRTSGFVYYVSVAGVTGAKDADAASVAPAVARVRTACGLPVAVGFGVKTPEMAGAIARIADAVVVGSVLVDEGASAVAANEAPVQRVLARAAQLADAVRSARDPAKV